MASPGEVVLLSASSFPDALRERWWIPSAEALAEVRPGRCEVKVLAVELEEDGGADPWLARPVWVSVDERESERFAGTITASKVDRAGFTPGERLAASLDRVFDIVVVGDGGARRLNEERARFAIGRTVLVGLTFVSEDGETVDQRQLAGRLVEVAPDRGLELELDDGSSYRLPPDVSTFEEAPPGEYRLRSTGEVVIDPDYLCTWTIRRYAGTRDS